MGGEKSRVPGTHFAVPLPRDSTVQPRPFCSLQSRVRWGTRALLTAGAGAARALHSSCVLGTLGPAKGWPCRGCEPRSRAGQHILLGAAATALTHPGRSHGCERFTKSMISTSAWRKKVSRQCQGTWAVCDSTATRAVMAAAPAQSNTSSVGRCADEITKLINKPGQVLESPSPAGAQSSCSAPPGASHTAKRGALPRCVLSMAWCPASWDFWER